MKSESSRALFARLRLRAYAVPLHADRVATDAFDAMLKAWWRGARARRLWRARLGAALFGVVMALLLVEGALRLPGIRFPGTLGENLFGCFELDDTYQGIHFMSPHLERPLFKPGFETSCYFAGYRWQHRGDRWGFRNPQTWDKVDVVLIGDSFVYGHGVEEHQTIAHFLRKDLGVRVSNLGMSGANPADYTAFLRNFGLPLSPKLVVVLPFANDLQDLHHFHKERLLAFVDHNQAKELGIFEREALVAAAPDPHDWAFERLLRWTLSYRTVRHYVTVLDKWLEYAEPAARVRHRARVMPPHVVEYARKLFHVMVVSAREQGVALAVAPLPFQNDAMHPRYRSTLELMREIAETEGVPLVNLRAVLEDSRGDPLPGTRLPRDGHLTELGNRLVAAELARFVREQRLLEDR